MNNHLLSLTWYAARNSNWTPRQQSACLIRIPLYFLKLVYFIQIYSFKHLDYSIYYVVYVIYDIFQRSVLIRITRVSAVFSLLNK